MGQSLEPLKAVLLEKEDLHFRSALKLLRAIEKEIEVGIEGTSMAPLISAGDRVSLHLVAPEKLESGDIFAFWALGKMVVHRLAMKKKVDGAWWLCQKGDNVCAWSWIAEEEVLGRVEAIRRSDLTLLVNRMPWTLINRFLGFSLSLWIRLQEGFEPAGTEASNTRGKRYFSPGNEIFRCTMGSFLGLCLRAHKGMAPAGSRNESSRP